MLTHFLRYEPVVDLIARSGAPGTLLEVGSGSRGIVPYLAAGWAVTSCDMSFDDYGWDQAAQESEMGAKRVTGSVLDLPFEDRSFDVVVASDLLEHLSADERVRALSELARVSRRLCIVGCPCGRAALKTDAELHSAFTRRGARVPPWLDEHLVNGFPEPGQLHDTLAAYGDVEMVRNTNVTARLWLARAEMHGPGKRCSGALFRRLAPAVHARGWRRQRARVLGKLVRGLDTAPVYRQFAVLRRA